jgi:DNA transformation protein and related proteins
MAAKRSGAKPAGAPRRNIRPPASPANRATGRRDVRPPEPRPGRTTVRPAARPAAARPRNRPGADADFIAYVLDQLDDPTARARAMFGGHGLYRGERFFGIVFRGRLYLKVDDATRPEFETRGMGPFRPGPGTTMRGYFEVPPEVLEEAPVFRRWTARALRVE